MALEYLYIPLPNCSFSQNEGILRSPLRLPPILPGDVTPPKNSDNDHGVDVKLDDYLSANDSHADVDMSDVIGDGIRAIRKV